MHKQKFLRTFALSCLICTHCISMEEIKENEQKVQKSTPKENIIDLKTINISQGQFNEMNQYDAYKVFQSLNSAMSYVLTAKEVVLDALKDPQNVEYTYVHKPKKENGFSKYLRSLNPSSKSVNSLSLVLQFISKYECLNGLTGFSFDLLRALQLDPFGGKLTLGITNAPQNLLKFNTENNKIFKKFIELLLAAHNDREVSELILNERKFNQIIAQPSLISIIGVKNIFPLQIVKNKEAANFQSLHIISELQCHSDTILGIKNLIFPDGTYISYKHNEAVMGEKFIKSLLPNIEVTIGEMDDAFDFINTNVLKESSLAFLGVWKNFYPSLYHCYDSISQCLPKNLASRKGLNKTRFLKLYDKKFGELNDTINIIYSIRNTFTKLSKTLIFNEIEKIQSKNPMQKVLYSSLDMELGKKKSSTQKLMMDLNNTFSKAIDERKKYGLLENSFFIGEVFNKLDDKKTNIQSVSQNILANSNSMIEKITLKEKQEDQTIRVSLEDIRQLRVSEKETLSVGVSSEIPLKETNEKDEGNSIQSSLSKIHDTKPIHLENKDEQNEETKSNNSFQNEMELEKSSSKLAEEEENVFGVEYFRNMHLYYKKLKEEKKSEIEYITVSSLTEYERNLYEFLIVNIFNPSHRPSWDNLLQGLRKHGFDGKPNKKGNGSTWFFYVTKNNDLFANDAYYRDATFNVHCPHGKKGNEPIPHDYMKFFQTGFSNVFGLTEDFMKERLNKKNGS